jgi:hypothetical protein
VRLELEEEVEAIDEEEDNARATADLEGVLVGLGLVLERGVEGSLEEVLAYRRRIGRLGAEPRTVHNKGNPPEEPDCTHSD